MGNRRTALWQVVGAVIRFVGGWQRGKEEAGCRSGQVLVLLVLLVLLVMLVLQHSTVVDVREGVGWRLAGEKAIGD